MSQINAALKIVTLTDLAQRHAGRVTSEAADFAVELAEYMAALWRRPHDSERELLASRDETRAAMAAALHGLLSTLALRGINEHNIQAHYSPMIEYTPAEWIESAVDLARNASSTKIPFLASNKLLDTKKFLDACAPVVAAYVTTQTKLETELNARLREMASDALADWSARIVASVKEWPRTTAPSADDVSGLPRWVKFEAVPPAAPTVFVGYVQLSEIPLQLRATGVDDVRSQFSSPFLVKMSGEYRYPAILDLDESGGFSARTSDVIESAILQLLDATPAGMLHIDAVDPVGLGKSLDFIYGLGESTSSIVGDAVWTTADQAAKLLVELEQHVTFVTQKYLQGQHQTLTQYNIAAGEVAEPYRAVVLYDFPQMFTRDGRTWDAEALSRLGRLVSVGRRAGVFFFFHTPQAPWQTNVALDAIPALDDAATFGAPDTAPSREEVDDMRLRWTFVPASVPPPTVRATVINAVLRGLQNRTGTQVLPERIAELARRNAKLAQTRGLEANHAVAAPDDPATWWKQSSARSVESKFGRMGSSSVASLIFNSEMGSSALIGGRPGSGKSFLFHALILDLVLNYSPDELELYLVDLKEGVEFKQYAESRLPHARAIAIESNREFAVSVLRHVDETIRTRGALFKAAGGATVNLEEMRRRTGTVLPRVVLMVDEFHKLFEQDDALRREAEQLLERIIKEGRAFGIHVVLGSQSLALVGSSFRSISDQILHRLVLASSDADSRLLLGEGNPDAQLLTRPGEGILNSKSGLREANERFQTSFWDPDRRAQILLQVIEKARAEQMSVRAPFVFEGSHAASADGIDLSTLGRSDPHRSLSLVLGSPMSLEPQYSVLLERAPGRNLLVIDDQGAHTLAILAADLATAGVSTTLLDFGFFDESMQEVAAGVRELVVTTSHRELDTSLRAAAARVQERIEQERFNEAAEVIILAGLHRARGLAPASYGAESGSLDEQLEIVLRDGPEVGIFVVAFVDRPASVERRLSGPALRDFGLKLVGTMSADDSRRLVDVDTAARLKSSELYFDDVDRVITRTIRRVVVDRPAWLHERARSVDGQR